MQAPDLMAIVVVNYNLVIYSPMGLCIGPLALILLLSLAKSMWWCFSRCKGVISECCICLVCRWRECLLGVPTQWCASY